MPREITLTNEQLQKIVKQVIVRMTMSRKNVEKALEKLSERTYFLFGAETKKLDAEIDARVEAFKNSPAMKKLLATQRLKERHARARRSKYEERVRSVKLAYFSSGMTPKIIKEIQALIVIKNQAEADLARIEMELGDEY